MSISPGSFWRRDADGITTAYNVGLGRVSAAATALTVANGAYFQTPIISDVHIFVNPTTPPASTEGNLYFDSTAHKLKVRGAVGFETVTSA